ncbi:hypothetical protein [Jannaschia ovalis]|uniref:Uncharacterized protein n=1 Tax=Jannaschia ovalis TaxID=3038773 RepID=A0ABY8L885_9RHOB|nr:hypothetical protein [Jannaschia sp. GRR-S6-38]WGH77576.1 hypothetical protein P8627_11065 [Jannaschia sp. GRR-S6-38]
MTLLRRAMASQIAGPGGGPAMRGIGRRPMLFRATETGLGCYTPERR